MPSCCECTPVEMKPTEMMTVNASHYFCLLEKSWQYDLLLNVLWEEMGLSPNGEELDLDCTDMIQWFLKNYKGFEYQVMVDKLKERKKTDGSR